MNGVEKFMSATLVVIGIGLVLTHPSGDKAAGAAAGSLYQSIVGAFFNAAPAGAGT